ncbi:MAG: VCBS repeat-containing protein, partial [Candidatus Omnitrophica bacterium]|nr:VCBS repeat-containing protein [Candidatus Omnitrophota bacterium]
TQTVTATPSHTPSITATPTATPTWSSTITATPSPTVTRTFTPTVTATFSPTVTVTATFSPTSTFSPTVTHTRTATPTRTFTSTPTPTHTPGHPIETLPDLLLELENAEIFTSIAVAELDGDPGVELVYGTDRTGNDDTGAGVHAINLDGSPVAGLWPVILNTDVRSSPAVADLDRDGLDEVVVGTYAKPTIRIFDHDGTLLGTSTSTLDIISSPAIGDLDGDLNLEIVIGSSDGKIHVVKADGSDFGPSWPLTLPRRSPRLLARNDVDSSPALGDLNGDGRPDIVVLSDEGVIYAYDHLGQPLPGFPFIAPADTFATPISSAVNFASPVLADVDGDGILDVIVAMSNARVYGLRGDGTMLPGFPIVLPPGAAPDLPALPGDDILSTPALGDVDGDGRLEMAVAFYSGADNASRLYVYDLPGKADGESMEWPTFHQNTLRTGFFAGPPTGDANRDGVVDGQDLIQLLKTWKRYNSMPGYNPVLDFNYDFHIDARDIPPLLQLMR